MPQTPYIRPQSSHVNLISRDPSHHTIIWFSTGPSHHTSIWFCTDPGHRTLILFSTDSSHHTLIWVSTDPRHRPQSSHVNLIVHRPPATGPSHHTKPFVTPTVLHGWPHLDLWGHWWQTSRHISVLVLLLTSSWQSQWRNRVRLRQQQLTDDVDRWWWRHHVFLYSCVESAVFLHTEWLHHLHCLLWVVRFLQIHTIIITMIK